MEATFKGNPVRLSGELPAKGTKAPAFTLTGQSLNDISLEDLRGKRVVLNIFPSLDTDVCAASVRRFNKEASELDNTVVLCVSEDLPLPQQDSAPSTALKTYLPPLDSVPISVKNMV